MAALTNALKLNKKKTEIWLSFGMLSNLLTHFQLTYFKFFKTLAIVELPVLFLGER